MLFCSVLSVLFLFGWRQKVFNAEAMLVGGKIGLVEWTSFSSPLHAAKHALQQALVIGFLATSAASVALSPVIWGFGFSLVLIDYYTILRQ